LNFQNALVDVVLTRLLYHTCSSFAVSTSPQKKVNETKQLNFQELLGTASVLWRYIKRSSFSLNADQFKSTQALHVTARKDGECALLLFDNYCIDIDDL